MNLGELACRRRERGIRGATIHRKAYFDAPPGPDFSTGCGQRLQMFSTAAVHALWNSTGNWRILRPFRPPAHPSDMRTYVLSWLQTRHPGGFNRPVYGLSTALRTGCEPSSLRRDGPV